MPLSQYNIYVEGEPEAGCTLVHNTFSGAYVVLEDATLEALQAADRRRSLTDAEQELASDPELTDPDVAILVASAAQEQAEIEAWLERRRDRDVLEVTVAVNRACNFACSYCCQADVLDGAVMPQSTATQVADWIVAYASEHGLRAIALTFIGGEPLLHPGRIEQVARRVGEELAGTEIRFWFSVTTNGFFLEPALVAALERLGLEEATVTLDGDETTHSRTRRAKSGQDTFSRILDNTLAASRRIRVTVNGNFQPNTLPGFAPLLRQLAARGLPPGSKVSFSPAVQGLGTPGREGRGTCAWGAESAAAQVALYDETLIAGFDAPPLDVVGPCQFLDRHGFAVDVDGAVYACPGFLGHPEWALGHVAAGLAPRPASALLGEPKLESCASCAYLPSCGGGCAATRVLSADAADACPRAYLESVSGAAVRRGFVAACGPASASRD